MKNPTRYAAALIGALCLAAASSTLAAPTKTIADLQKAYLGETTAHAKYAAYAKVADSEGYRSVASLFRAASAAERIHANNHKAALADLGVTNPKAGAFTARPGTTEANLKDALKGETYEKNTMYPGMIKDATAENEDEAVRSMTYALSAEKQHAALYAAALKNLKRSQIAGVYYVCPVCGATYAKIAPVGCPTCGTPRELFKKIV